MAVEVQLSDAESRAVPRGDTSNGYPPGIWDEAIGPKANTLSTRPRRLAGTPYRCGAQGEGEGLLGPAQSARPSLIRYDRCQGTGSDQGHTVGQRPSSANRVGGANGRSDRGT